MRERESNLDAQRGGDIKREITNEGREHKH